MQAFETERLLLRPLVASDFEDLYELYRQPEVMRWVTREPRSREVTRRRLEAHMAQHECYGFGLCAAILKQTGRMIGRCGLIPYDGEEGVEGELAWMYLPEHWGGGLATEFGRGMIDHGFAHLGLERMFARAYRANGASVKVMQKLGMRPVPEERQRLAGPEEVEYEILRAHRESGAA